MDGTSLDRQSSMRRRLGVEVAREARILEFGCGAGRAVNSLLDAGYTKVIGFEIRDYIELRSPADRAHFVIGDPLECKLPFENDSFDVVVSD